MIDKNLTLFLDFDGVLHPLSDFQGSTPSPYLGPYFIYTPILIDLLRPYLDNMDIVISSAWGYSYSLNEMKDFLPKTWADRVVDAVYPHLPYIDDYRYKTGCATRWAEIAWYREHIRHDIGEHWLAIDDDNIGWPAHATNHLAHCEQSLDYTGTQPALMNALLIYKEANIEDRHIVSRESKE